MTVEDAVIARLLALSAVTTLVMSRVYLERLPQSPTYPCVRVALVSDGTDYQLRGGTGVMRARVQVDAFAKETSGISPYALAAAVAEAVKGADDGTALSGWRGSIGSPAMEILACQQLERRTSYDPEELRVVTMSQDFMVTYRA